MPQKGKMKKLRQTADCGTVPQSGKMRDEGKNGLMEIARTGH